MRTSARRNAAKRSPLDRKRAAIGELWVGIDTGGTFTDIVYRDGRNSGRCKVPSTPDDAARAVLEGLRRLFEARTIDRLAYGTTVATNAMLERRGARTALVTTQGFEDVLEIGRQARPDLYDLEPHRPPPLIPARLRFGLDERVLFDGTVERRPSARNLSSLLGALRRGRVRSIAVCLLHAHVEPANERALARALAALDGVSVTLSHELSPQTGEYERSVTTAANAYVRPIVSSHLGELSRRAGARRFLVMQSNGGAIGAAVAAREPIRTMLSGPAGGVASAHALMRRHAVGYAVTLDMGGTSTDVALLGASVPRRPETSIGGMPVRTPCIDIHTVGAGGGSIARVDAGGALKVGPDSAGAEPGPACYGRGSEPTVTDANLVLGRLRAEAFLGGGMTLDGARSENALRTLARGMGVRSAAEAADGVIRVIDATMERAIRLITVERGQDPRECALIAFGGAAGLHVCALADALQMPQVLIPRDPGLFSAWGVLDGPVVRDVSEPLLRVDPTYALLGAAARRAMSAAKLALARDGVPPSRIAIEAWVRMRYAGQSIELEVPLTRGFRSAFDRKHMAELHTADSARSVEVTGIRATAIGDERARTGRSASTGRVARGASTARRIVQVWSAGSLRRVPVYERDTIAVGASIVGPAIVTEYSATSFVAAGWSARVAGDGTLVLSRTRRAGRAVRKGAKT
jgi:N-methylhydantoinase A/oxoprolinase/acetone carboxylase beta subunit